MLAFVPGFEHARPRAAGAFIADGCTFGNNSCDWGTLAAGKRPVAGRWFLTDCTFQENEGLLAMFREHGRAPDR